MCVFVSHDQHATSGSSSSIRYLWIEDEYDYEYEIFSVLSSGEPTSFWRENVVAVVILLRVLARCRSGRNKISNVRSFIIFRSGERVTSFTKDNSANISSEKW